MSSYPPQPVHDDYTEAEVARARRKTDFIVLPIVVLMFVFLQFDRTNIGNALTDTFEANVGVVTADINLGQTLFTLGIVLFEIPSNIVSQRLGPNRWVPSIQLVWGIITMSQAALKSRSGFLATRFLLASFEAGFIPGMAWYLTGFYRTNELALRLAIFWAGNNIAGILSGVLALGILGLNGTNGLHGWQFLFLIEGGLTCAVAVFGFLLLPSSPFQGGRSIVGRVVFTQRDAEALASALTRDDPRKASRKGEHASWSDVRAAFSDWRLYGHCASAFLSSVMLTPMNTYGPSIVKSLGYKGYTANGMVAPGAAMALVVSITLAFNSDRTKERGIHIAVAMFGSAAGCYWLAFPPTGTANGVLYAGYVVTAGFMGTGQAINAAWLSSRVAEHKRVVSLACYVMCIQMSGFVGSNIFKAVDAPRYSPGLIICGSCALAAGVVVLAWKAAYAWDDKRTARAVAEDRANPTESVESVSEKKEEQ